MRHNSGFWSLQVSSKLLKTQQVMPNVIKRNTGSNPRGDQWVYTINNYVDDDVLKLRALHTSPKNKVLYHSFQAEVGESGTPHLQGFIAFENTKTRSTVANLVSRRAWLARTEGTPTQANTYCQDPKKRDPDHMDIVHSYGDLSSVPDRSIKAQQPGKRNDLRECKRKLDEGASVWALADEHWGNVVRYHKAFTAYKHARTKPRDFKTAVFIFYGAPGTGKSRAAFNFDAAFVAPTSNGTQWMDGYDPDRHRTIIFDDFHASVPAHVLLRLLDGYPLQFPTKGGFVEFRPESVVLTSNYHPKYWYKWDEIKANFDALIRRVEGLWEYFLPETQADKDWCKENDVHCLVRSEIGSWHPQIGEFKLRDEGVWGVPIDFVPEAPDQDELWAYYDSLLRPRADEPEDASESPEVVEISDDDSSQSDSSLSST